MKTRFLLFLTLVMLCAFFAFVPKAPRGMAAYPPPETNTKTARPPLTITPSFDIPTIYPAEKTAGAKHAATQTMLAYICDQAGLHVIDCSLTMTAQADPNSTPEPHLVKEKIEQATEEPALLGGLEKRKTRPDVFVRFTHAPK